MWKMIVGFFKGLFNVMDKAENKLEAGISYAESAHDYLKDKIVEVKGAARDVDEVVSEVLEEIDTIVEREVKDVKGE